MIGVLDTQGMLELFAKVAGRRFVGPVDGYGYVELVFDDPQEQGSNLVSICTEGRNAGLVLLGFVDSPERYVASWREWLREAA